MQKKLRTPAGICTGHNSPTMGTIKVYINRWTRRKPRDFLTFKITTQAGRLIAFFGTNYTHIPNSPFSLADTGKFQAINWLSVYSTGHLRYEMFPKDLVRLHCEEFSQLVLYTRGDLWIKNSYIELQKSSKLKWHIARKTPLLFSC